MTTAVWWNCFSGIAGDMALASLVDAGADLGQVVSGLQTLPVEGWALSSEKVPRGGLSATRLVVESHESADVHRQWADVRGLLDGAAGLPTRALFRAHLVFERLAEVEGRLHGVNPDEVHFHEVGALDAIIDIVGTCLALELLDVGAVFAGPVTVGVGSVRAAHGLLPNPAPAVADLLKGAPVVGVDEAAELTTPTGAALLAALARSFGPLPAMKVSHTGYGAGHRDLAGRPNVVQVLVGELAGPATGQGQVPPRFGPAVVTQDLVQLEANVDDVSGEILGHAISVLMTAGALDAWAAPVTGKKGRPAHVLSALASGGQSEALALLMARETGALGVRAVQVTRWALPRHTVSVEVRGLPVRVKVGPHRAKAEHDDCVIVAAALGWPVSQVARRAEQEADGVAGPIS